MTPETTSEPRPTRVSQAIVALGSAGYVAQCLGLLRGLLYTRALPPKDRGAVQLVFLIATYLAYAPLSIYFGLEKNLPLLIGAGRSGEARQAEREGINAIYGLSLLAALAMWVYAALRGGTEAEVRMAIVFGGFYLVFSQVASGYRVILRSRLDFGVVVRSTIYEGLLLFAMVVAGAYLLGAPGTMAGWALGVAVVCLLIVTSAPMPGLHPLHFRAAFRLVRVGLPVLAASLTNIFLRTADNLVVAKQLGLEKLGYYGLAWQLASYLYNVAGAADAVLTPRLFQAHGRMKLGEVRDLTLRSTTAIATLMPFISGVAAIGAPIVLWLALPRYAAAVPALRIFCFTVVFMALPMAARTIMIARNRELELVAWEGAAGLLIAAVVWVLSARDVNVPLSHIALVGGVGLFLSSFCVTFRALTAIGQPPLWVSGYLLTTIVPFAYAVLCVWGSRHSAAVIFPNDPRAVREFIALGIFLVTAAPLLWWTERRTGALSSFCRRHPRTQSTENS